MRIGKRSPKFVLAGTGIAFIISGVDCLDNNLIVIAVSSFIVGTINIVACLFVKKHPFTIKILLLLLNAIFAFLSSYIYFNIGKNKIQYAWALVGVISLVVVFIASVKKRRVESKQTEHA